MNDALGDILETVELKATFYFRTEFFAPFGIAVPQFRRAARFHLIVQGQCFVRLENGTVIEAMAGDLIFVPYGIGHVLASDAERRCKPLEDVMREAGFVHQGPFVVGSGSANQACKMICGHYDFADASDHPLLRAVPEILHLTPADRAAHPILDDVLRLIVRCAFTSDLGAEASINRLSEALFIEIMRMGVTTLGGENRFLTAISDPQIGRALTAIHSDIARPWTVGSLANMIGMSRTRFSERFRDLTGSSPMAYVAEWRLQRSLYLLNCGKGTIKTVAGEIGFASVAAFSRAFRARFGHSPSDHRKQVDCG